MTDLRLDFAQRPWDSLHRQEMTDVAAIPTMLARDERLFYHWVGSGWCKGVGDIVDLGAFVGGSTARLAAGLGQQHRHVHVHAYDRFTVTDDLKERLLYPAGIAPFDGPDLLPVARDLLAPWSDRISFHKGAIENIGWCGRPIEVLAVDAFKSVDTMDQMVRDFFPSLIPGRSLVIQQDFLHKAQPWIPALMLRLRDVFRPLAYIRRDTLVFQCTGPVTDAHLRRAQIRDIDDDQLRDALRQTRRLYRGWGFSHRIAQMEAALTAAPGCRVAWQMRQRAA